MFECVCVCMFECVCVYTCMHVDFVQAVSYVLLNLV